MLSRVSRCAVVLFSGVLSGILLVSCTTSPAWRIGTDLRNGGRPGVAGPNGAEEWVFDLEGEFWVKVWKRG
jgi:hypothetical protein